MDVSGCNVGDPGLAVQLGDAAVISGWQQHTGTGVQRVVVWGSRQYRHWRTSIRANTPSLGDSTTFALFTRAGTEALLKPAAQHATRELARILIVDQQNFHKPEIQRFSGQRSRRFICITFGLCSEAQLHKVLIELQESMWTRHLARLNGFRVGQRLPTGLVGKVVVQGQD